MIRSRNRLLSLALVLTMLLGITSVAMAYTCTEEVVDGKLVVTEDYGDLNYVFVYEGSEVSGTYTRTYTETETRIGYNYVEEYKDDAIIKYTAYYPDGYYETGTFDADGYGKTINSNGDVVGEGKKLEDGSVIYWYLNRDGFGFEYIYGVGGGMPISVTNFYADGHREETKYDKGKKVSYGEYYPNGDSDVWTYDKEGNTVSKTNSYTEEHSGYFITTCYDGGHNIISRTEESPFGYSQTTTYDGKGNNTTVDNAGNVVGYYKQLEGGGHEVLETYADGNTTFVIRDKNNLLVEMVETAADGTKKTTKPVSEFVVTFDDGSSYIQQNTETYDENGNLVGATTYGESGEIITWEMRDGIKYQYIYSDELGEYDIEKRTYPDGTVEIRTTIWTDDGYEVRDEDGNVLETYTETYDEKAGEGHGVAKDANGKIINERFFDEEGRNTEYWYFDKDANKVVVDYDYENKICHENVYDTAGNLIIERTYDLAGRLVSEKKYEVQKVEKVKYV